MVGNNTIRRTPLLPDRHPIQDFFICDVTDAIPKDDMGSMEHPIFSLATKPDLSVREYEHNGVKVAIIPSTLGLATIHDKDTTRKRRAGVLVGNFTGIARTSSPPRASVRGKPETLTPNDRG
jgi:hypothetical protein